MFSALQFREIVVLSGVNIKPRFQFEKSLTGLLEERLRQTIVLIYVTLLPLYVV